ncbi:VWA domain-containing protein [Bacillus sp. SD088]|uniref:VWA domain-containing protein n=1 Tax=Bacillus sp. SD088 TaxID=2782012 RepID=UPI001A960289|nr:VWA domain-containing protein [Bacillus sp. SD088]MBO0994692.1 VWA domain-containing protein [Bacillus sp. SD088]
MGLQVEKPLFLLLLIPAFIVLYLYWKKNKVTPLIEKNIILTIRFLIFAILILSLSVPNILYPVKGITTVFVIDQSESVKNQEEEMFAAIEQAISGMEPEDSYAVISTAENAQIIQSPSNSEQGLITNVNIENKSYTNLEEGLQLASSLLSSDKKGRIVLMTDGNENMGDARQQVELLHGQEILIDVLPFNPSIQKDVAIESFSSPSTLYQGENAKLTVNLSSTMDTKARVRITKNNETVIDEEVQVKKGENSYNFIDFIKSSGVHNYKAEIISDDDGVSQNNQSFAVAEAKGPPQILMVDDETEGDNLLQALEASDLTVTKTKPELLPTSLSGFLEYEMIIFNNISATDVTQEQMEMIESAVRDFGKGFVMAGGNKSYGLGGYFKTPIEKLLPVEMDLKGKKELPSLGMVIVLDRSGSMSGYKLDLAKEAAARSIELLRNKDTLGFIAFDDKPWTIIETGPLDDKVEAAEKIRSITEGGGTEIFTPLEQAYNELKDLKLQRKHIILLTDGQSATNGDYSELISTGLENNVTLSTVAIGGDADRFLLEQLATEGTGRFYDVQDASTIPSILSRETVLTTRTYIEDNPFYPMYTEGNNWGSVFEKGVPVMNAYVATEPKSRAETILMSEKNDPVLTRWQYGLGNTVAWTSDTSGEWAGEWPAWSNWPSLWNEIITWSFPTYENELYDIEQTIDGKNIKLDITSINQDMLPIEATVVDEKGKQIEADYRIKSPGEHEVNFTAGSGIYSLQLAKFDGEDITSTFQTGIVVPYSKEFKLQNQNNTLLNDVIELGNGKILTDPEEAFRPIDIEKSKKQPITMQLLLIAFLLFFIEIAIRRFGVTLAVEKIRSFNSQRADKKEKKEKEIKQKYSRLKKSTSKVSAKPKGEIKKVQTDVIRKVDKQPKTERKKDAEQPNNDNSERLKRLLDAKNRRNKW